MKMNLSADRQGYLRDLNLKSIGELKELLERQEKLLSRRAFLQTLADKGVKCGKFAEELRILISEKVKQSNREDHIQRLHLKDKDPDVYSALADVNPSEDEKEHPSSSDVQNVNNSSNDPTDLASNLQNLTLGGKPGRHTQFTTDNAYEKVIKKTETNVQNKERFMPNRSLKDESNLAATLRSHPPLRAPTKSSHRQLVPEESNVRPPDYKFKQTKMISIEESVELINQQKDKAEKLSAENAAKRLASHLVPKMSVYTGAGQMSYREPRPTEQEDSDDVDDDDDDDDDDETMD